MTRSLLCAAACAAALLAVPDASFGASGFCSISGGHCYEAKRKNGVIRLSLYTFAIRGRVRTCVTTPGGNRTCRRFRLRSRQGGVFGFDVRWSRHFPNAGRGRYRVRFLYAGDPMGPAVSFRIG